MQELIKKYNITKTFLRRYLKENAENRFGTELQRFMWYKEGKFLNPQKKDFYIESFIKEEIENFYEKNIFNIPQIAYCITTKCTLKCRDCNALIPKFNSVSHIEVDVEEFKRNLDKLCNSVNKIRHFVLIGGEPLMHPKLHEILEYTCQKSNIDIIRILSNGTIVPSQKLLDILSENNKKVYFYISNYAVNGEVKPLVKHDAIIERLKQANIKYQIIDNWSWYREYGFSQNKFSVSETICKVNQCSITNCIQLLNRKLDICPKASSARELGLIDINDYVDMNSSNLREDLINFYKRDYQQACQYCILNDGTVQPALQEK